jgi:cytoskeletal protein CcmA (bactofilin family)
MQSDVKVNSTIGSDSYFGGRFLVKGSMRIEGTFEGRVLLVDQLEVGAKARVKTNISATSVVVEGIVIGNIAASKRILLLATARVLGDLKTPELIIQDGVILEGHCTISHVRMDDTQGYIQSLYDRKQSS